MTIEVEDAPEIDAILEELRRTKMPIELRQHGKVVAVIEPVDSPEALSTKQRRVVAYEALRRAAGEWEWIGLDLDEFREGIRESRRLPSRPLVSL